MRLIDADALSARMYHDAFETDSDMQKWDSGCWIRYKMFENAIEDAPTIKPQPKTGKWIEVHGFCTPGGDPVWACSECGKGVHVYGIEHGSYGSDVSDGQWKACPNCGAKMKDGDEHESC